MKSENIMSIFIVAMMSLFISCKSKEIKPVLEISFKEGVVESSLSDLTSMIGTGSGEYESFGERKSILVFFEEEDCLTCNEVKPVVDSWVKKTGFSVLSYRIDYNQGTKEEISDFLKKLGSSDGINLTSGRLVAFVDGKRKGSISGNFDIENTGKVDNFVKKYFDISSGTGNLSLRKELTGINELRAEVNDGNTFLLYLSRNTCPDCRKLSDPKRDNIINQIAKDYRDKFYRLNSENIVAELDEMGAFEHFEQSGTDCVLWNTISNKKRKAEHIAILVSLGLIPPCVGDDNAFLESIDEYALGSDDIFTEGDRSVPAFILSNKVDIKDSESVASMRMKEVLKKAYTASMMTPDTGELPHRALFTAYFSPDNNKIEPLLYYDYLKSWLLIK